MPRSAICTFCKKEIIKSNRRYNEEEKFGWNPYCSLDCLGLARRRHKIYKCSREGCNKTFNRLPSDLTKSKKVYCSLKCAACVNNKRIISSKKKCKLCNNFLHAGKTYCSPKCKQLGLTRRSESIIKEIQTFYLQNSRIPFKREYKHYHAARERFGTWNNAIITAGLKPNPLKFAKKYRAKDGHKCDSLAEKIIDDWLFRRKIKHERSIPYPRYQKYTADFLVGDTWIEYFGLSGELKSYDRLKRIKINLAYKLNLDLIKVYPKDLFTKGRLDMVLKKITS